MAEPLSSRGGIERLADTLDKPIVDNRTYRVIRLPNELEALLIHDPDTDKASAAMDVNVGSYSDTDDLPGLAHAVEHSLFMGTEKYPGENDYNTFLTKYGGHSNAFTAATSTNYYFELSSSAISNSPSSSQNSTVDNLSISKKKAPLYGALDRFAQFFVKPLFSADTLDRELRAVDSENKKNLQSDAWRLMQLGRSLSNPKHPNNKFSTGNYEVLHDDPIARGVNIRDAFIGFYKRNYSANRMKLVVLGKEELDELQGWVEEFFSDVPNQGLPKNRWDDVPLYTENELCTQILAKTVMESRNLELNFPYPDEDNLYASQPGRYISHLVGHEGPGSILSYIKAKGWANELSAGGHTLCPGTAVFGTSIRLTEDGLKNYKEIIKVFFQYIALVKDQPPQQWIVDEMIKLSEVDFKFMSKSAASRTTSHLSGVMQKPLPREWLLSGQHLVREFNPDAIKRGLASITPDNLRFTISAKEVPGETPLKEKWYGTEYSCEKIPQGFMKELREIVQAPAEARPSELFLPGKNEFIAQRLDVEKKEVPKPLIEPKLIRNDENVRTWFKKDDRFWVPKAHIELSLRSPLVDVSPMASITSLLYKELVQDSLTEYAYDAELAGLRYGIDANSQGLEVQLGGYNDKMDVLLKKVLISMRDLEVKDERFEIIKERVARSLRNFEYQDPFRQIGTHTRRLFSERGWAFHQLLDELPSVTAADVRAFFPQVLKQMHIELLVHGNLYKEDALRVTKLVEDTLKPRRLPPSQWPTRRAIVLPEGSNFLYPRTLKNPDNINHCIEYLISVGSNVDRPLRAKLLLLAQMIDEPCFDQLRTKEQLGYVVASGALVFTTVAGFRILIQSERECDFLEQRIDLFLTNFETVLKNMPSQEFEEHKIGLINKRLENLKNLAQETTRFWHHITSEMFDFESVYRDVDNIEPLTKDAMLDFYRSHFLPTSPTRAKASVHLIAQASAKDIAAKTNPTEQREKLVDTLSQVLSQLGLEVDNDALASRLEKVDLSAGDQEGILSAVGGYLKDVAGMAEEQVENVKQQGQAVLAQILPSLGISTASDGEVNGNGAANGNGHANGHSEEMEGLSKPVLIKDVQAWKASMPASAGARPVKDLSEFEEFEAKL